MPQAAAARIMCACGRRDKSATRLPKGWHRHQDAAWCPDCWHNRYVLRAITLPVVEPRDATWDGFRAALAHMWALTTQAANWMFTELYARDARRNGQEKMPPMPYVYLYPEARMKFPDLTPQSLTSIERSVQAKYRAKRYQVIWLAAAALPTQRYPQPYPVHNQSWSISLDCQRPVVSALFGVGGRRFAVRLKGGPRYYRQLRAVRQMIAGDAKRGEAAFLRHPDGQILCKMVAWLPRAATPTGEPAGKTLTIKTDKDRLLVAAGADRTWVYNADHLRRWIAQHDRMRRRLAEDQKAEQRPVPSFADRRTAMTLKQSNRMRSALQQIAAQLTHFAVARRATTLSYDDAEHGYIGDGFPWFSLREHIARKCDEFGIAFVHASAPETTKSPEPPAEQEAR